METGVDKLLANIDFDTLEAALIASGDGVFSMPLKIGIYTVEKALQGDHCWHLWHGRDGEARRTFHSTLEEALSYMLRRSS